MRSDRLFFMELVVSFLPFVLFAVLNGKANVKKAVRHRQYAMPIIAVAYCVTLLIFLQSLIPFVTGLFLQLANLFDQFNPADISAAIRNLYASWGVYLELVLFNTVALLMYVSFKRIVTLVLGQIKVKQDSMELQDTKHFYPH